MCNNAFSKSLYDIVRLLHSWQGASLWMMLVQLLLKEEDCFLRVSCLGSDDDSWRIHSFDLQEALAILRSARLSLGWLDGQYGANATDPDLWSTSMTIQGIAPRDNHEDGFLRAQHGCSRIDGFHPVPQPHHSPSSCICASALFSGTTVWRIVYSSNGSILVSRRW